MYLGLAEERTPPRRLLAEVFPAHGTTLPERGKHTSDRDRLGPSVRVPGTAFQLDDDLEILLLTDVVRTLDAPLAAANAEAAPLLHLQHAAGVVEHSEPFPVTWTSLQKGHTTGGAEVEGRNSAFSSVDQPKLTQGTWVRPGGVVVEAA